MADQFNSGNLAQIFLGNSSQSDPSGSFARRSALEEIPGILVAVRQHSWQISVSWTRPSQAFIAGNFALIAGSGIDEQCVGIHRIRTHDGFPLGPFCVLDGHGDRRSEGGAVTNTGQNVHDVLFEALTCASSVSKAAASQCLRDGLRRACDAGG